MKKVQEWSENPTMVDSGSEKDISRHCSGFAQSILSEVGRAVKAASDNFTRTQKPAKNMKLNKVIKLN